MEKGLAGLKRTHSCGELNKKNIGTEVILMGWVHRRRDHGGLIFVDLRDRTGLVQLVFNPEKNKKIADEAGSLRTEFVISVRGKVVERSTQTVNKNIKTGEIEVHILELSIINKSKTTLFNFKRGLSKLMGSLLNTSNPAPAILLFFSASISASSSTTGPREIFIRKHDFFIKSNSLVLIKLVVSLVRGTESTMKSESCNNLFKGRKFKPIFTSKFGFLVLL